jgi:hypothetical protein
MLKGGALLPPHFLGEVACGVVHYLRLDSDVFFVSEVPNASARIFSPAGDVVALSRALGCDDEPLVVKLHGSSSA